MTTTTANSTLTGTYTLDATHSTIGFVARHAMVTKVRGAFTDFAGTAVLDFDDVSRVARRRHRPGRQRRDPQRPARRAPAHQRLLRRRHVPGDPVRLHVRGEGRRRELQPHRRPDDQGRHEARHRRLRVHRCRRRPVGQPPRRVRGPHDRQPQGLGRQLQRRARGRRRAGLREDHAGVRHLGDQERLTWGLLPSIGEDERRDFVDFASRCPPRRGPRQDDDRLAGLQALVRLRRPLGPRQHPPRPAAGEQRRHRHGGRRVRDAPAPRHGDRDVGPARVAGPPGLDRALRGHLPRPRPADERRPRDPALGEERLLAPRRRRARRPRALRADVGRAGRERDHAWLRAARDRRRTAGRAARARRVRDARARGRRGDPDRQHATPPCTSRGSTPASP